MRKIVFLVLVFLLAISSCAKISVPDIGNVSDNRDITENNDIGEEEKTAPVDGEKNNRLTTANGIFSWELLKTINEEDLTKDVFISPLSISTMLAMALNGAEGTTREAMEKTLHYDGLTREEVNRGYAWLIDRIHHLDPKVTLEIANSIWVRDGFSILPDFVDRNRNFLDAEAQTLNFDQPGAAERINDWIAQKTHDLIPHMISPPIHPDVMMYLINAIYFKGEWTTAFEKKNTSEKDFYALDGKTDTVSMMYRNGKIDYVKNDEYQAVSLPYGNEKTSMIVILPEGDINRFIDNMNHEKWGGLLNELQPVPDLNLQLPKFKMEYGIKELKNTLSALGMGEALSESADFSSIADNLYISKVLHKAVVDVNEEGTEAAAVTVGEIRATAYVEPLSFIANRPFLFVIADKEEGNILFIGKKIYGDR